MLFLSAAGFRSLAEKEPVEYELAKDDSGRAKAVNVTGPAGAPVKGAPKPRPRYYGNRKDGNAAAAPADGQPAAPVATPAAAPAAAAPKKQKAAPAAAAPAAAAAPKQ